MCRRLPLSHRLPATQTALLGGRTAGREGLLQIRGFVRGTGYKPCGHAVLPCRCSTSGGKLAGGSGTCQWTDRTLLNIAGIRDSGRA